VDCSHVRRRSPRSTRCWSLLPIGGGGSLPPASRPNVCAWYLLCFKPRDTLARLAGRAARDARSTGIHFRR
jgi:hypothetical protein